MRRFSLFVVPIFVFACSPPLPELEGVRMDLWQDDRNGCNGKRALMEEALTKEKDKLKGLSEMQVVELLGKPDERELYRRNQKFYSYYVTPGPDCRDREDLPKKLVVRFNALGYAQSVTISASGQ